ncbi:M48 family metalloprotease [Micromonospora echinofusca]|uniref:M48 family metalloprotease n=1 Tax=Micromonospora echinofusca TaxID=47858 RepID=A0ABS3VX56_MICEH|nr:M48 family metalloprotease [Micromonospora echinofusca]MBO4209051.1 M48 family metalloprotease [Micromonospora echinofusca]
MTGTPAAGLPRADDRPPAAGTPYRLGWLYVLVLAALAAVGSNAGAAFFVADRSRSLPWAVALETCSRAHPWQHDSGELAAFSDCFAGASRARGFVLLAGVGVVLAVAASLLVLVPLVDRWRLRRAGPRLSVPGADARFAVLCDRNGLTGRRRPRLRVAGPPVRQAFTTGTVGRRPTVVLPAAVAVTHRDPYRFDPVVEHELAHVRAGDVGWVAVVRGLVWLPVPVMVAAVLLELASFGANPVAVTVLARAAVLAALTAVLAAALLRAREREADRHAVQAGHGAALAALLTAAAARRTGPRRWPRPLARHPDPLRRLDALATRAVGYDGGLLHASVVGAVALLAMVAADGITRALHQPAQGWLAPPVAVGVHAVLLVAGLLSALTRRARLAEAGGTAPAWWRPLTGVTLGTAGAALVVLGFPQPGESGLFRSSGGPGATLLVAGLAGAFAAAAVGLSVLLTAVATVPAGAPNRRGAQRAVPMAGAALAGAVAVLWLLPALSAGLAVPGAVRNWLVFALPRSGWPLLALAVPVVLAALLPGAGPAAVAARSTTGRAVVAVVGIVGGAAVLWTRFAPPADLDRAVRLAQQRWLLCALAGWLLLVALGWRRDRWSVAWALVGGWSVAALTGVGQYLHSAVTGRGGGPGAVQVHVVTPLVWFGCLAALTLPLLLTLPARPARVGNGRVRSGRWVTVARVAGSAAVLPVLVYAVGDAGTVPLPGPPTAGRPTGVPTVGPSPQRPDPASGTPAPDTAGRLLTPAQVRAAAEAVRDVLPRNWQVASASTDGGESRVEPAACEPLASDAYLDPLTPGRRARAEVRYETPRGPVGVASTRISVTVTSHAAPVPASVFAAAEAARSACRRFTVRDAGGGEPFVFTVGGQPPPVSGEQSWRLDQQLSYGQGRTRITGHAAFVLVRIGHNLVTVHVTAVMEPLDEVLLTAVVRTAVQALGTG